MDKSMQLPAFEQANVLIVGDLILDRYWHGDVSRISPEAPVPVVNVENIESRPGGAANVAVNVAALGAKVSLIGMVGKDDAARELASLVELQGVTCQLQVLDNFPTVTKLRLLGQNQQLLRMDFEKTFQDVDTSELLKMYQQALCSSHVVVLSDYAKGTLANPEQLIQLAREQGVPVLVDPKADDFARYAGATMITPNRKEFEAVVGHCQDQAQMVERARNLLVQDELQTLLITCGKDGMLLVARNEEPVILQANAREVFDVTGAGDTVIAVMAAGMAAKCSYAEAANLANHAAGVVVGKIGASTVSAPELRRSLQRDNASQLGILTEEELLIAVSDARAHNEKIVMTNGCFDILHAGHVEYLEKARALGDRLIVAINDDASVARLKGEARPLNSLRERMEVIAALSAVDWVVAFSEDTPQGLIVNVLPDVLVKGGDYQVHEIAGHSEVLANGGEVQLIKFRDGCSTTGLIEKIKGVIA